MILAIDTETNDKPASWRGRDDDTDNWPRLVQLGCVLTDNDGKTVFQLETLVKPDQWSIAPEAQDVHGFSDADCELHGVNCAVAIRKLSGLAQRATTLVAHNMAFDWAVLLC